MPRFYGYRSVVADLRKHKFGTGKVTSATLILNDGSDTNVSYRHAYVWPSNEQINFGEGSAGVSGTITLWRIGETSKPRVGDTVTVGGLSWLIGSATTRLNGDESRNYAVYDCQVTRPATSAG